MRGLGRPPWRAHDRRCRHGELRFAARSSGIDVAGESDDRRNRGGHHARDKRESCRHTINVNSPSHRACERVKCFSNHLRNYPHFAVGVAVIQRRCHPLAQLGHGRSGVFCCSHSTSIARFMPVWPDPSTTGNRWAPRGVGVREMTARGENGKFSKMPMSFPRDVQLPLLTKTFPSWHPDCSSSRRTSCESVQEGWGSDG